MIEVLGMVVGVLLIVGALVITAVVLGQSSKNARQSGVIAGSAETLLGKSKGKEIDRKLNVLTMIVAIIFVALVLAMYIVQPDKAKVDHGNFDEKFEQAQATATGTEADTTTAADDAATTTVAGDTTTTAAAETTTAAPETAETPAE